MSDNSFLTNFIKATKVLKLFGYATFSVHATSDNRVHVSRSDFCFFFGNLLFASFVLLLSISYEPVSSSELKIMAYVTKFVMNSASTMCIVALVCVMSFRNRIWRLVRLIDTINVRFASIGVDVGMKNFKKIFVACLVTFASFQAMGLFIMAFLLGYYKKPVVLVIFSYLNLNYSANCSWIMVFQMAVIRRFKALNRKLRNLITFPTPSPTDDVLTTLQTVHFDLIKCIKLLNLVFGFPTMLCVGICYLFTFFTLFAVYKALQHDIASHTSVSLASCYWSLYYNAFITAMILMCFVARLENKEVSRLISRLCNSGEHSKEILHSFGNQASGQEAKSSCGLFDFDLPLLGMMFTSIVTYFIIMVQFEMAVLG